MADAHEDATFGDQLRQLAAHAATIADLHDQCATDVRAVSDVLARHHGLPGLDELVEQQEATAYRLRTFQRINAEVARQFDAMMAAGGPENAEAYEAYRQHVEFASALLPTAHGDGDLGT